MHIHPGMYVYIRIYSLALCILIALLRLWDHHLDNIIILWSYYDSGNKEWKTIIIGFWEIIVMVLC